MRRVHAAKAGFEVIRFSRDEVSILGDVFAQAIFLGQDQSTPLFAIDTGAIDDDAITTFSAAGEFVDLREIACSDCLCAGACLLESASPILWKVRESDGC